MASGINRRDFLKASVLTPTGPLRGGMPHPRNYGTFPRFLGHYVRKRKIMGLPEAVKKMTSMPAAKVGLKDRGAIRTGEKIGGAG